MRKLYTSCDRFMVGYLASVLEENGIPCVVKNEILAGAAGELPPTECWPELWVADDTHFYRATRLLEDMLQSDPEPGWRCPGCGEAMEGQFGQCWSCGALKPSGS